jgi:AcrR family transcriptional regulator
MARREPVQKRSRERVAAILRAAQELLAEGGVEALTTRSLAAYSGIPVATIYRYFEDRDAIIAAYLDHELEAIDRACEEAVKQLDRVTFRSMTHAVAFAHLRHHQQHPEGIPVWFGTRLNAAVHDSVRELDARMASSLHAATRGAGFIEKGPHFGARLIVRLWDRTFEHIFRIERSAKEQEAIVEEVVDMISSYMERYATPAGLEGVSSEEFLNVLRGGRRERTVRAPAAAG